MKQTTKSKILNYLKGRDLVSGSELENQSQVWVTKASTISRRARELADEGKIERYLSFKKTVQYKLAPVITYDQVKQAVEQERLFDVPRVPVVRSMEPQFNHSTDNIEEISKAMEGTK